MPSKPRAGLDLLIVSAAWIVDVLMWDNDNGLRGDGEVPGWLVPAVGSAVFATLLVRRRYPVSALAIQLMWATVTGAVMEDYTTILGVLVALHAVAVHRSRAWSLAALLACAVPFGIPLYLSSHYVSDWLTGLIMIMLVAAVAWGLGHVVRRSELRAARQEAERVAAEQAVRAERLRLARELHDIVAHAVSIMVLQAAGARAILGDEEARVAQALGAIQDVGVQSMGELRRLLCLLRSASDDNDGPRGSSAWPGIDDIPALIETTRATGLAITQQTEGSPVALDPSVGLTAYRLVQEALTNTIKHAGTGAAVEVRLVWGREQLAVTIEDRGPATPARDAGRRLSTGHGLLGLEERVTTVGGTLEAGPLAAGFLVHALLPLARQPAHL
jgi:signal transduction histidine kinase